MKRVALRAVRRVRCSDCAGGGQPRAAAEVLEVAVPPSSLPQAADVIEE